MPIYRVEGVMTSTRVPGSLVFRADSEGEARAGAERHGLRPETVVKLRAGEIPTAGDVIDLRPSSSTDRTDDLVRRLAHSNLINHPIKTIACGTFLGIMAVYLLALLFMLCFGGALSVR
jgi:hypothetical protein